MMAGDGNGDGDVSISDIDNVWRQQTGTKGYLEGDFDMGNEVMNQDKNDLWFPNKTKWSFIPE